MDNPDVVTDVVSVGRPKKAQVQVLREVGEQAAGEVDKTGQKAGKAPIGLDTRE